jgi:drug/metabolite transporter (DMT)-like permease
MENQSRAGIRLALAAAFISGVSIYLNKAAVTAVGDPLLFTTLKNSIVGGILLVYLASGRVRLGAVPRRIWPGLAAVAVIGGGAPFLLFFEGLSMASAPSAALIHKSLFIWVALLAVPLLGERPGNWLAAGLGLLAFGQILSGRPGAWGWGAGESLVLLATLLWAVETILVKRLLPELPTAVAAAARMAGGSLLMWGYLLFVRPGSAVGLTAMGWSWVAITSVLLLGYVSTWYGALKRAPAAIVTGLLPLGAVITAGITVVVDGDSMAGLSVLGLAVLALGGAALIRTGLHPAPAPGMGAVAEG